MLLGFFKEGARELYHFWPERVFFSFGLGQQGAAENDQIGGSDDELAEEFRDLLYQDDNRRVKPHFHFLSLAETFGG